MAFKIIPWANRMKAAKSEDGEEIYILPARFAYPNGSLVEKEVFMKYAIGVATPVKAATSTGSAKPAGSLPEQPKIEVREAPVIKTVDTMAEAIAPKPEPIPEIAVTADNVVVPEVTEEEALKDQELPPVPPEDEEEEAEEKDEVEKITANLFPEKKSSKKKASKKSKTPKRGDK